MSTVWPELADAVPEGVTLLCLPEVEGDHRDFNAHPRAEALTKRLREWARSLCSPTSRASMGTMQHRPTGLDLSDLKRHSINIPGGGAGEDKPFRVVFQDSDPMSAEPTITVVAVGQKIGKDDQVYERKVGRRWGRERRASRPDGYWLELRLIADHLQRQTIISDLSFGERPHAIKRSWETFRWWPARVTLMASDCEDFDDREPRWVTDMVTLSCDYETGRQMLRTVGEVCAHLRKRGIKHELGF